MNAALKDRHSVTKWSLEPDIELFCHSFSSVHLLDPVHAGREPARRAARAVQAQDRPDDHQPLPVRQDPNPGRRPEAGESSPVTSFVMKCVTVTHPSLRHLLSPS